MKGEKESAPKWGSTYTYKIYFLKILKHILNSQINFQLRKHQRVVFQTIIKNDMIFKTVLKQTFYLLLDQSRTILQ